MGFVPSTDVRSSKRPVMLMPNVSDHPNPVNKSTRGSSTPKKEIDLIRQRLNRIRTMEAEND